MMSDINDTVSTFILSSSENATSRFDFDVTGVQLTVSTMDGGVGVPSFNWTSGTLQVSTVNMDLVNRGGRLSLGDDVISSTYVSGQYTQLSMGTLTIELSGTQVGEFDQLEVSGSVTLGGHLHVQAFPSFTLESSQSFKIISCNGTIDGSFGSYELPSLLSDDLTWNLSQLNSDGIIWVEDLDDDDDDLFDIYDGEPLDGGILDYDLESPSDALGLITTDGKQVWLSEGIVTMSVTDQRSTISVLLLGEESLKLSTFNFSSGYLAVSTMDMGSGTSTFNWTGGTLMVSTVNMDLNNQGGILSFIDDVFSTTYVSGNYTQSATATLSMAVSGTENGTFDQLVVNGDVILNGTLFLSIDSSYTPQRGDQIKIVSCNGHIESHIDRVIIEDKFPWYLKVSTQNLTSGYIQIEDHLSMDSPSIFQENIYDIESDFILWLDGSNINGAYNVNLSDGSAIGIWTDLSGKGNDVSNNTSSAKPIFSTFEGKPVVDFDGINDVLAFDGSVLVNTDYTIFITIARFNNKNSIICID
jgi:hypothetical protein